jgi:hypothetical protein
MVIVKLCNQSAMGIPPGQARWKYVGTPETGGGWVEDGCNCNGLCSESPAVPGTPGQTVLVTCGPCPPDGGGGEPTDPGPEDEKKKRK